MQIHGIQEKIRLRNSQIVFITTLKTKTMMLYIVYLLAYPSISNNNKNISIFNQSIFLGISASVLPLDLILARSSWIPFYITFILDLTYSQPKSGDTKSDAIPKFLIILEKGSFFIFNYWSQLMYKSYWNYCTF